MLTFSTQGNCTLGAKDFDDSDFRSIGVLRMLLLKKKEPEKWAQIMTLQSQRSLPLDRPELESLKSLCLKKMTKFRVNEDIGSIEEWMKCWSILEINEFRTLPQILFQSGKHLMAKGSM